MDHLWCLRGGFGVQAFAIAGSMKKNSQPQIPALGSGFAVILLPKTLRNKRGNCLFLTPHLWLPVGNHSLGWNFTCHEK